MGGCGVGQRAWRRKPEARYRLSPAMKVLDALSAKGRLFHLFRRPAGWTGHHSVYFSTCCCFIFCLHVHLLLACYETQLNPRNQPLLASNVLLQRLSLSGLSHNLKGPYSILGFGLRECCYWFCFLSAMECPHKT